jgi:hypothetical protein
VFWLRSRVVVCGVWGHDPVYWGLWATRPRGRHRPAGPTAVGHSGNVASVTRRRTERPGPLEDIAKMPLSVRVSASLAGKSGY